MKPIVLLSGPVGAGKSTVAQELVDRATEPIACIEGDTFWSFIKKSSETQERLKTFGTVMAAMTAAALPYARADYEVIVDFSIPPWFLGVARKIVLTKGIPLDYVVLRPSERHCAARAAGREEGRILDYNPYKDLYASFDGVDANTISDEASGPAEIAAVIREGLDAGRFRLR